ncbi:MAG: ABC transporter substrate-binding protein [Rhizobiales bacterium]|nr:ABC transporter substrate-binding protein [Hyphomicrobiales bacterium]
MRLGRTARALAGAFSLAAVVATSPIQPAMGGSSSHGLSAFGELKYPADFKNFEYVNPQAPKGGRLTMIGTGGRITFDSFNLFITKGDSAEGLGLVYDSLMTRAFDEPDAVYGLVARSAEVAEDRSSVTFEMRPEARFADGEPVEADDVVFTLEALKAKGDPRYRLALRDVVAAEAVAPHTVRFRFQGAGTRDLPLLVAGLPILPRHWYEKQAFEESFLVPPLGSGPYAITAFRQGQFVTYGRRADYWGWGLAVNAGRYNFDELRFEYFKDRTAELEALKAGVFDLREEFTSRDWATAYDIAQVREGRLKLLTIPDERPAGTQGFFINLRREKFADIRVRQALDLAFDFEWTNRQLFYGLYKRTESFFQNSDMMAEGPPSAGELALLEPFRGELPAEVFGPAYLPPVSDGSGQDRKALREADRLLKAAGWSTAGGQRVNAAGQPFTIEFLLFSPAFERIVAPYVKNLKLLGIDATIRLVDPAQYERRLKSYDFDITTRRFVMSLTPGPELFNMFGSEAAGNPGSFNTSGIASPVVDALIERALAAKTREELVVAVRALDRVLRAGHYWVPQWYKSAHNIVFWDRFSWPETKPLYDRGVIETWWYDEAKAKRLAGGG